MEETAEIIARLENKIDEVEKVFKELVKVGYKITLALEEMQKFLVEMTEVLGEDK